MIIVKDSSTHGKGGFAAQAIPKGTEIIEYLGKRFSYSEFANRDPIDPDNPTFTYAFVTTKGYVIEAAIDGNDARFINHSCEPNCYPVETDDGRVFYYADRDIAEGEELFIDYRLALDEELDEETIQAYACHCGTPSCRGTMLDLEHEPDLDGMVAFRNSTTASLERIEARIESLTTSVEQLSGAVLSLAHALAQHVEAERVTHN